MHQTCSLSVVKLFRLLYSSPVNSSFISLYSLLTIVHNHIFFFTVGSMCGSQSVFPIWHGNLFYNSFSTASCLYNIIMWSLSHTYHHTLLTCVNEDGFQCPFLKVGQKPYGNGCIPKRFYRIIQYKNLFLCLWQQHLL